MTTWHAQAEDLAIYRDGAAGPLLAASLEAHLVACSQCRRVLASVDIPQAAADSERRWDAISGVLDAELEDARRHSLIRVGASTRPLAAALAVSVILVLLLPLIATWAGGPHVASVLMASAPLAPMVAVAFAFRRETDPAGELSLAAPLAGIRLVARRALLVAAFATPVGVLGALTLGLPLRIALAWLLPGLAMSALVLLAGTTRLDPAIVTAVIGGTWALGVLATARRGGPEFLTGLIASAPSQTTAMLIAVAACALVAARRDRLAYRRRI